MDELPGDPVGTDRVGSALRKLAEDAVAERRVVALLRRENRDLRAQLGALVGRDESQPLDPPGRPEVHLVRPAAQLENLDRLRRLREILPALAEDAAAARRQATGLRRENARLLRRIEEFRATGPEPRSRQA